MGVTIKVTKRISPKDKSKIKRTINRNVSVRTDKGKITYIKAEKNVSNNKKNK